MRKQPVTRREFLGSGIAAVGAISIGGALPANARDWEEYSARFDRSISDGLPANSQLGTGLRFAILNQQPIHFRKGLTEESQIEGLTHYCGRLPIYMSSL